MLEEAWLELELWLHEVEGASGLINPVSGLVFDGFGRSLCFEVENKLLPGKFGDASSGNFE